MIEGVKQIHELAVGDRLRLEEGRIEVEVLAVRGATVYVGVPRIQSAVARWSDRTTQANRKRSRR